MTSKEQSKLYIFGERILAVEDGNLDYASEIDQRGFYNVQKDILNAKVKYRDFIDEEAMLNNTTASVLFFMNDGL